MNKAEFEAQLKAKATNPILADAVMRYMNGDLPEAIFSPSRRSIEEMIGPPSMTYEQHLLHLERKQKMLVEALHIQSPGKMLLDKPCFLRPDEFAQFTRDGGTKPGALMTRIAPSLGLFDIAINSLKERLLKANAVPEVNGETLGEWKQKLLSVSDSITALESEVNYLWKTPYPNLKKSLGAAKDYWKKVQDTQYYLLNLSKFFDGEPGV